MSEGRLEAPFRRPLDWENPDFYDEAKLDAEMRRVLDICHGCRRCFNLCDSFPRLFDLVDESAKGELETVASEDFKQVVDACTLCDMCFLTKCPYVPPHEFDLDFPHLMLRYRAVEAKKNGVGFADRAAGRDRPQRRRRRASSRRSPIGRPTSRTRPRAMCWRRSPACITRPCCRNIRRRRFEQRARRRRRSRSIATAPGFGRKAVIYATCFGEYNDPDVGLAARAVLAKNGVETEIVHPHCCGMPLLEQGLIGEVAAAAKKVAAAFEPWIDKGYDVIALVPSCALMLKFEWPLIVHR